MDHFNILAKTVPFLLKISRPILDALLPGHRAKLKEAERLRGIGDTQYRDGHYELAVNSLWESLRLNAGDTLSWLYLIRAYRLSNQTPLALVTAGCAMYVTDNPARQSRIWSVIGQCNRDNFERSGSQQDILAAITAFDRATKLDKTDVVTRWNLLEMTLLAMEAAGSLDITGECDLSARAVNVVNDLIALLRSGEGNAATYAGMIAANVRRVAGAMNLSDYWRAQFATLEACAQSLSQIEIQPAAEPTRRHGLTWRMALSTAAFLLIAALAFMATGCSTNIIDPVYDRTHQTAAQSLHGAGSQEQSGTSTGTGHAANAPTAVGAPTPPLVKPTNSQIRNADTVKLKPSRPDRIDHINGDDGRSAGYSGAAVATIVQAYRDHGSMGRVDSVDTGVHSTPGIQ